MRLARLALPSAAGLALALAPLSTLTAQRAAPISTQEIDAHLRFLSSDLLEGRAPATRGGELATAYIASVLQSSGLEPGVKGGWFQQVPIDIVGADAKTLHVNATGKATAALRYPEDVAVWAGSATPESKATGEIVFVGYGASAPEYKWDDYKGSDLHGKILLFLVNDPPAPASEPNLFGGNAMTYYGRWTYKFEEAERRGAAGALIVHTTARAGYPWHTVVGSWAKEQRMLPRPENAPAPLGFRGWITDTAATALLAQAGLDLAKLTAQAASRDFRPVPTGIMLDAAFSNRVAHQQSANVVGVVPGRDPKLRTQYVVLTAHWDHLGIGPAVNGDSIYNGASDNASGVADMLAVARAAAQGAHPRRSLAFVFVTGEESGLLGSEYFAEHPTMPVTNIVANLNMDGGSLLGRSRDLVVLGATKSSLGPQLAAMVKPQGMRISPEDHPEAGYFYRSDHFSFAKVGVPAVSIGAGDDIIGKPAGWGKEMGEKYTANNYHQPSDEYQTWWDLRGDVQLSGIVLDLTRALANSSAWPTWATGAEFHRQAMTEAATRGR